MLITGNSLKTTVTNWKISQYAFKYLSLEIAEKQELRLEESQNMLSLINYLSLGKAEKQQ